MKKLIISNLVYGEEYTNIFLNYHLKSLLDVSNIPSNSERLAYAVYTDDDTLPIIDAHPNFQLLAKLIPTRFFKFRWSAMNGTRFDNRYNMLDFLLKSAVRDALDNDGAFCSAIVADLFYAKEAIPRILRRLDEGHDSVLMHPLRSAFEPMSKELDKFEGAPTDMELFNLGYRNLHPLWVACHWKAAQFSAIPYQLLWNSGKGLLSRSFSVTPIAFTPKHEMLSGGCIDLTVPHQCANPYWCTDWTDAPIIGVEPLHCFYPMFMNRPSSVEYVREFGRQRVGTNFPFLKKQMWYPSRKVVGESVVDDSDKMIEEICR